MASKKNKKATKLQEVPQQSSLNVYFKEGVFNEPSSLTITGKKKDIINFIKANEKSLNSPHIFIGGNLETENFQTVISQRLIHIMAKACHLSEHMKDKKRKAYLENFSSKLQETIAQLKEEKFNSKDDLLNHIYAKLSRLSSVSKRLICCLLNKLIVTNSETSLLLSHLLYHGEKNKNLLLEVLNLPADSLITDKE